MDLLSVMNQRVSDLNTELRHTHKQLFWHCFAAGLLVVAAVFVAPCMLSSEYRHDTPEAVDIVRMVGFIVLEFGVYATLLRGAYVLNSSHFFPTTLSATPPPVGTTSFFRLPPNEQLNGRQRNFLSKGFYVMTVLTMYFGITSLPSALFLGSQLVQLVLYGVYVSKLYRLMSPTR